MTDNVSNAMKIKHICFAHTLQLVFTDTLNEPHIRKIVTMLICLRLSL